MKEIYERQTNGRNLIYTLEDSDVLEVKTLQTMAGAGGRLEGFVPTTFYQDDGTKFISYDLGEMVTLEEILERPMPLGVCLQVLEGLRLGMATAFAQNLDPNTVPLDPYHVYSDPAAGDTRLLCIPLQRQQPANCNLKNLCLYVSHKAKPELEEDADGFEILCRRLQEMEFVTPNSLGQLLEEFRRVLAGEGSAEELPAPMAAAQEAFLPKLFRVSTGEEIELALPELHMGKQQNNHYVITGNPGISRNHSVILTREEGIFVVDLNSTNGTYINGQRIPSMVETLLTHGAKLRLGNELFIACLEQEAPKEGGAL